MSSLGVLYFELHGKITHVQFNEFLKRCSDMVDGAATFIFDNAPVHKRAREVELKREHRFSFLPPYSPMFNPIEELFSTFKSAVKRQLAERRAEIFTRPISTSIAQYRRQLLQEIARESLENIAATQCNNWDRHMFSFVDAAIIGDNM